MLELINSFILQLEIGITGFFSYIISYCIFLIGLSIAAWFVYFIINRYLKHVIHKLLKSLNHNLSDKINKNHLIERLSFLAPGLLVLASISILQVDSLYYSYHISILLKKLTILYLAIQFTTIINSLLNILQDLYQDFEIAHKRPIRTYVQLVKLILMGLIAIITISILIEKSAIALLTGMGAATAVIMLVFKDSILGFVASVQLSLNDMVRIGDWIDMPDFGASGDVVDISLNTVKILNFDKTVTTIPTYALLTSGVKNWRGMKEAGGRRIKRSIYLDMHYIKFCDQRMLDKYQKFELLSDYLKETLTEISHDNSHINDKLSINLRKLTNVGVFRHYLIKYITTHPKLKHDFTCLIRQLQPNENGLPIEIYAFTKVTDWSEYENIQADIFDHILAMLPEFELAVLQGYTNITSVAPAH